MTGTDPQRPAEPSRAPKASATAAEGTGWAARTMGALRWAEHLVLAQLLVVVGTLAGGVVLGLYPALDAAGRLLSRLPAGDASTSVWLDFWRAWRGGFRRANLLGAPVTAAGALLLVDGGVARAATGPVHAALTVGLVVVGLWIVLVLAYLAPVLRRYDDGFVRTWRFLLLVPAAAPAVSAALVVTLGVLAVLFWSVPVLGALGGVSLPLLVSGWMADLQLDRVDERVGARAPAV
ncbi:YesL family protein [Xylanimonas sp. McL0601]|uniref:YesL family protein n=1 Tax=Xylanimonas sp. McL0601 TaxID=3414739 RepID=UPI003CF13E8A